MCSRERDIIDGYNASGQVGALFTNGVLGGVMRVCNEHLRRVVVERCASR